MSQRVRYYWLKILIGIAFGILVVDVLVLAVLVVPLRASQQAPAATPDRIARQFQANEARALVLPTHDPSKPWPTRTPLPTATPWLFPTKRAPQRSATPARMGNAVQMSANMAGLGITPGPDDTAAPVVSSASAQPIHPGGTPSPAQSALPTVGLTSRLTATVVLPALTPVESQVAPSDAVSPTVAPTGTQPPPPPEAPVTSPDDAEFKAYVQGHYNAIAGQPLDIAEVRIVTVGADIPTVTVEVAGDDANSVLSAQTAAAIQDYGRRLLDDTKRHFDGRACAITVVGKYTTTDPEACAFGPNWCVASPYNQSSTDWSVAWTYALGTSIGGTDAIQAWNSSP